MLKRCLSLVSISLTLAACSGGGGGGGGGNSTPAATNTGILSGGICSPATVQAFRTIMYTSDAPTVNGQCAQIRTLIGTSSCQIQNPAVNGPNNGTGINNGTYNNGYNNGNYNGGYNNGSYNNGNNNGNYNNGNYNNGSYDQNQNDNGKTVSYANLNGRCDQANSGQLPPPARTDNDSDGAACNQAVLAKIRTLGQNHLNLVGAVSNDDENATDELSRRTSVECSDLRRQMHGTGCYVPRYSSGAPEWMSPTSGTLKTICDYATNLRRDEDDDN